jgi:2-succinyl-5-enolpyruvyl-6-hydroxy-3-cyclohexene-1-carboxylate synthase
MNISWAKEILHQLVLQGVDYFCLAPGSRSTPLAFAVSEDPRVKSLVHYDERGVAFHALGYAKATQKPVALISTSGTAVGNFLPAIMEASNSRVPLIVLTADRPPELRDVNANQTVDQVKVFHNFVRWQYDLPCPDAKLPKRFLSTTIGQAIHRAKTGPVHLNCMFREPLFTDQQEEAFFESPSFYEAIEQALPQEALELWSKKLSCIDKGVLIAGSYPTTRSLQPLLKLAERLDWPLLADIDSGIRSYGRSSALIPYFDLLYKTEPQIQAEAIVQFGDRLVSKSLLEWIEKQNFTFYCHVADHPERSDPKHQITHRISCDPVYFSEELLSRLPQKSSWLKEWKQQSQAIEERLTFSNEISEPGIIRWIENALPADWALFFANSMPVRDAESFFFPKECRGPVFTSRGVSGIDGNIATVAGMSEGSGKPLFALIGDQTALHDLNSLPLLKKTSYPVILCIVNNSGGGIFSFLPIAKKAARFEEFWAAQHEFTFEHAAKLFQLPYYHPSSWKELNKIPFTESCILELTTDRAHNYLLHQEIFSQCTPSFR